MIRVCAATRPGSPWLTWWPTPASAIGKLHDALVKATESAAAKSFFAMSGSVAWTTTPEALAHFQAQEAAKWGKVIQAAGIQPE